MSYQTAPRMPHPGAPSRKVRKTASDGERETKGAPFPSPVQKCTPQTAGHLTPVARCGEMRVYFPTRCPGCPPDVLTCR